ncbi:MAG: hypothetical protein JWP59_1906 [Massilia sp.]|nr:hypothetical protein [Massilia sp.]
MLRPSSVDQVAGVMRACHAGGVRVVPQGVNSGPAGGATLEPIICPTRSSGLNVELRGNLRLSALDRRPRTLCTPAPGKFKAI